MATLKLTVGDKDGKTYKKDLSPEDSATLVGKKLGEKVHGASIGFEGYEFEITGGSDYCGFPMRKDLPGTARKKVLITGGVGLRANTKRKGLRIRKMVAGNTVHEQTVQVNLKVLKAGKEALGGAAPVAEAKKE